jgi:phage terminase small subunit
MANRTITVSELAKEGGVSRQAIHKAIRAGNLTLKGGVGEPVKLLAEWRAKHDPSRNDRIGPALGRIIEQRGLKMPTNAATVPKATAADQAAVDASGAPAYLSPAMKAFWRRATAEFELEADAKLILRTACTAYDRATQARELIAKEGLIVNNRRHPAVDIEAQSQSLFLRSIRQLSLDIEPPGPIGRPVGR